MIAALSTVAVVTYRGIQARSQQAALQAEISSNSKKFEVHKAFNASYPGAINDCPNPAATNLCIQSTASQTYAYRPIAQGGAGSTTYVTPAYDFTVFGSKSFAFTSNAEVTSSNEFLQYVDLGPIIDRYGIKKYELSFDIKSASIASASSIVVYFQNGSTARYGGLYESLPVATQYQRKTVSFTPVLQDTSTSVSMLAFYGTYSTGNIPTVKNLQFQLAP